MTTDVILEPISRFIKENGFATLAAIAVAVFCGTVVWGMNNTLNLHVQNDTENNRLLRVICEGTARDDSWRRACVDNEFHAELERRMAANSSGSAEISTGPSIHPSN